MKIPPYRNRIQELTRRLKAEELPSAMVVTSSPQVVRSWDQNFVHRQDSNFYYLTGSLGENLALIIQPQLKRPVLLGKPVSPQTILWDGKPPSASKLAEELGVDFVESGDFARELLTRLKGVEVLYHSYHPGTWLQAFLQQRMALPSFQTYGTPRRYGSCDIFLEQLRLYKDPWEVAAIQQAAELSSDALKEVLPFVRSGIREQELVARLDFALHRRGAMPSFGTIMAAGSSAAVLHYRSHARRLKNDELLLVDWGAELNMYAADTTRCLPVSGKFDGILKDLYDVVLEANKRAIATVRHGVLIQKVYDASAKVLTQGLVDLKVLKGKPSQLMAKKAYRPYFPHGIGHSLGIDVHDIGHLRANNKARLLEGMVFTIEPGLYFPKKTAKLPPSGVRIEDDILVTKNGAKVLTPFFPKERKEVEDLLSL